MKNRTTILMAVTSIAVCFAPLPKGQATPGEWPAAPETALPGFNTADGDHALFSLTTGVANTAVGWYSLFSNTDGSYNTALGVGALLFNVGDQAASDGLENTAIGAAALLFNTTGSNNTAVGVVALENNTTGNNNTAIGVEVLTANTDGTFNTAIGSIALTANETGDRNTGLGRRALENLVSGDDNTAVGQLSGTAFTTENGNVCIGQGVEGVAGFDDRTYIRNVNTDTVAGAGTDFVTVELASGRVGHFLSSRRYKEDIKPMDKASETLYRLKPVTFRYKKEVNYNQSLDYGLIAEDVAQVDPNLVTQDVNGQIENVRFMAVNAMLLNEFLKEHKKVEAQQNKIENQQATIAELKSTVAQQQKGMEVLTAQLKEQAAQIQKVSAELELNNSAAKTVAIDQ